MFSGPDIEDTCIDSVMHQQFTFGVPLQSHREAAETMMRMPNEAIDRHIKKLQARIAWLEGWKKPETVNPGDDDD